MISSRLVLVRGTGDVASAVAHALFKAGHRVLCHDISAPAYSRRGMAFTDAIFRGLATLEGVLARRAPSLEALQHMLGCCNAISVATEKFPVVLDWVRPTVVVDARMRKRTVPETQVDLAIETSWGEALGEVVERGPTRALAGEPREIGGIERKRFVYAPSAGLFRTDREIGDVIEIEASEAAAMLDGEALFAPLSGRIRGLFAA